MTPTDVVAAFNKDLVAEGFPPVEPVTELVYQVGVVRRMLDDTQTPRQSEWGKDGCFVSRKVHGAVWEWEPEVEYVRDVVIPQLEELRDAVAAAKPVGEYADSLGVYAQNVNIRIQNLRDHYLEGKPSSFDPYLPDPPSPDSD